MKQNEIKEVAQYIAHALGTTGINIKICVGRLKYYTNNLSVEECQKFIQTAFEKNKSDSAETLVYIASVLTLYGVENPDIWWKNENKAFSKETKNSLVEEIQHLLQGLESSANHAGYYKHKKESVTEEPFRTRYEHFENESAEEIRKFKNDIIDIVVLLSR